MPINPRARNTNAPSHPLPEQNPPRSNISVASRSSSRAKLWHTLIGRFMKRAGNPAPTASIKNAELIALRNAIDPRLLLGVDETGEPLLLPRNPSHPTLIVGEVKQDLPSLTASLAAQRIARGDGLLFLDFFGSRAVRDNLARVARIVGREADFYVLDPSEPTQSNSYSPWTNGDADEMAAKGLSLLSEPEVRGSESTDTAKHLLTVIIAAVQTSGRTFTTEDLHTILQSPAALEALLEQMPEGPSRLSLEIMLHGLRGSSGKIDRIRFREALGNLAEGLSRLMEGPLAPLNELNPEVDITEIVRQGKCLYVCVPSLSEQAFARFFAQSIFEDVDDAYCVLTGLKRAARPHGSLVFLGTHPGISIRYLQKLLDRARTSDTEVILAASSLEQLASALGVERAEALPDYFPLVAAALTERDVTLLQIFASSNGAHLQQEFDTASTDRFPFVTAMAGGHQDRLLTRVHLKLLEHATETAGARGNRSMLRQYPEPLGFASRRDEFSVRDKS
jgi:hypothetical protein